MIVRAKKMCFVNGSRRRPGDVFRYDGPEAKYLEPVKGDEAKDFEEEVAGNRFESMKIGELQTFLGDNAVKFAPRTKKSDLVAKATIFERTGDIVAAADAVAGDEVEEV